MTVHIALLILICFLAYIVYQNGVTKQKNKFFIVCSCTLLFLVEALRAPTVGYDTNTYVLGFNILAHDYQEDVFLSWTAHHWEPFWKSLNYSIAFFTYNPQWLLIISSLIIVTGVGHFIYTNCNENESAFWPLFYFITLELLYPSSLTILRQFVAMVILLYLYSFLIKNPQKRKNFFSCFLLIIAMGFHYSSIICGVIIICLLRKNTLKKKQLLLAAGLTLMMPVLFLIMKNWFIAKVPYLSAYILSGSVFGKGESLRLYIVVMALFKIICFALIMIGYKSKDEISKEIYFLSIVNLFSLGCLLMQTQILMATRMEYYFGIFTILLIPKLLNKIRNSSILYILSFLLCWGFYLFILYNNSRGIVPYNFFWQV